MLDKLGLDDFFLNQVSGEERPLLARVTAEHRGLWEVRGENFTTSAQLAGRLRKEDEEVTFPGVGDWVVLREVPQAEERGVIARVLSRKTVFTRGAAGREARVQVIAANVDLVFVVCGLDTDFNVRRIERYLARVWASGAQPVVLLSKADLCEDVAARVAEVESHAPGVPVLPTSGLLAEGLDAVRACLRPGLTVAFVGSSGAGKSTLVNALLAAPRMETGEVRARDGRGQHITTHRQLLELPSGGVLVDTPGMRELQLVDTAGLESVFDDITELAAGCRFGDCRHHGEPGCAVQAAVDEGTLDAERLVHFLQLEREAASWGLRHDERRRRQSERVWGALSDEGAMIRRLKGRD